SSGKRSGASGESAAIGSNLLGLLYTPGDRDRLDFAGMLVLEGTKKPPILSAAVETAAVREADPTAIPYRRRRPIEPANAPAPTGQLRRRRSCAMRTLNFMEPR